MSYKRGNIRHEISISPQMEKDLQYAARDCDQSVADFIRDSVHLHLISGAWCTYPTKQEREAGMAQKLVRNSNGEKIAQAMVQGVVPVLEQLKQIYSGAFEPESVHEQVIYENREENDDSN